MQKENDIRLQPADREMCTFYVDSRLFGIDILRIQEINKSPTITAVPRSHEFIIGVMNLRGRIVTVIDLAKKLGLSSAEPGKTTRTIIVKSQEEYIGLMADRIGDVVPISSENVEPPPINMDGSLRRFIEGVLKIGSDLIGVIDVEALLE